MIVAEYYKRKQNKEGNADEHVARVGQKRTEYGNSVWNPKGKKLFKSGTETGSYRNKILESDSSEHGNEQSI